jgi:hypothetical protein
LNSARYPINHDSGERPLPGILNRGAERLVVAESASSRAWIERPVSRHCSPWWRRAPGFRSSKRAAMASDGVASSNPASVRIWRTRLPQANARFTTGSNVGSKWISLLGRDVGSWRSRSRAGARHRLIPASLLSRRRSSHDARFLWAAMASRSKSSSRSPSPTGCGHDRLHRIRCRTGLDVARRQELVAIEPHCATGRVPPRTAILISSDM